MMVSLVILVFVFAGVAAFYGANRSARVAEDLSETMEAQLRVGMDSIMFDLRSAGYGTPTTNLSSWIPWVAGMTSDPLLTVGAGSNPDTISIALCTSQPVGTLAAAYTAGAATFTLDAAGAAAVDTANKKLIYINNTELAQVYAKTGTTITPDTSPNIAGPQPLSKSYNIGTPICRVDVVTFSVDTTAHTLLRNDNQGAGAQIIIDGITNMKIVTDATGIKPKYAVTLTATSSQYDPLGNSTVLFTRSLASTASKRN